MCSHTLYVKEPSFKCFYPCLIPFYINFDKIIFSFDSIVQVFSYLTLGCFLIQTIRTD